MGSAEYETIDFVNRHTVLHVLSLLAYFGVENSIS